MAQNPGAGLNWAQKFALWTGLKMASFLGSSFTLTDAEPWKSSIGLSTATGKSVNDKTAMQISTVWACVRILAEAVGQLPWAVYRTEKSGNLIKVDDDPLADVLIKMPNSDMTSNEYREALMTNMGLRGNAYSLKETASGGRLIALYPIPSLRCESRRKDDGSIEYSVLDRGKREIYPADKIWHNRIFSFDGLTGLSPIGYAREAMGFALGLEEFGARLFGQGANVGSIIKFPHWLKPDQRIEAEKKLAQLYQGLINTGKPFILEGGMEMDRGILPPQDAQFLELRGFEVDDICRFYLVPPHRVARLEKATNNNIEQLSLEFVMYTLLPYLVKLERSADRWLVKPGQRGERVVRFNYDGLLRADSEARSKLQSVHLQNGVVTRNEVRAQEHLPRSNDPSMDEFTVQSNMISVDDLKLVAESMRQGRPSAAEKVRQRLQTSEPNFLKFMDSIRAVHSQD